MSFLSHYWLIVWPALAFISCLVLTPLAITLAVRCGFVDRPGGRKQHEKPVPPVGGLVIFLVFLGLLSALPLAGVVPYTHFWPFVTALISITVIGALDDRFQLKPNIRLLCQLGAACLVVIGGGIKITQLGDLFGLGTVYLGFMAIPFSVFCVVLLINAFNMMDGLDGLAGGKSLIVVLWLAVACLLAQAWQIMGIMLTLGGAIAAFLVYNMRHPFRSSASIFLGDSGSMGLGLILAWFTVTLAQTHDVREAVLPPIAVAWILSLPVMDAFALIVTRIKAGRHPFEADRLHFHHHFIEAGFSPAQATACILCLGFVWGGIGVGGSFAGVPDSVLFFLWLGLLGVHTYTTMHPHRWQQRLRTLKCALK